MKKIFLLLFCVVLTGCSKQISLEQLTYNQIIEELKEVNTSDIDYPFDISLEKEVLLDEYRYTIIINNVKEKINDVQAVAYHNYETDDVFPSIGIFDEVVSLEPNGENKGIILVGYIDVGSEDVTYKLYIKYRIDEKEYEKYWILTNVD